MKKKVSKPKPSKSAKSKKEIAASADSPPEVKPLKKAATKPHYVDPVEFSRLIVESYGTDVVTDDLANCVLKIATRLAFAPNFINYSYRDEMVGDAIVKMLYAIKNKKFDPKLGNSFSYFTRIAFNAFCNRIKKEKKEKEFVLNLQDSVYDDMINSGMATSQNSTDDESNYDNE